MRFHPDQHLRRQADFEHVRTQGRRYDAGAFTLFFAPRRPPRPAKLPDTVPTPEPARAANPELAAPVAPTPSPATATTELVAPAVPTGPARAGFVASRSAIGNAVARARAKRRLREAFRAHQNAFPPGIDLIFIARRSLNGLEHAALQERFSTLCRKLFPPRAA